MRFPRFPCRTVRLVRRRPNQRRSIAVHLLRPTEHEWIAQPQHPSEEPPTRQQTGRNRRLVRLGGRTKAFNSGVQLETDGHERLTQPQHPSDHRLVSKRGGGPSGSCDLEAEPKAFNSGVHLLEADGARTDGPAPLRHNQMGHGI